ncbi:enoyl-CoA hydratase-related protein [Brevundimonas sp. Bb-A]|jgi:enoyl-CoA hydratase/carnithine racemase|uniref:enoyl-CoA hydratase-related protein n=1 Tax=Brevundimonas sp. Bb-A TaxID=2560058 RepID=UPI00128E9DBA|nr:enoyl-CoA hydratase-related protein [Brevundimonas sp. Bb-A]QFU31785.1 Carnitinyl-CoA dehydratase [Brevundimonas sp. Bb-A]
MTFQYALVEREGPLTIVTLNRPQARNALNSEAHAELADIFDAFAADPDQWVAILTGAGDKAFCAGQDLAALADGAVLRPPPRGFGGLSSRFDLNKPIIAAVNGIAFGGGFELALACDIVVALETAKFALPEPKVGLAALGGGIERLPREIGLKRAMGMMLTGKPVSATEGLHLGFVNEVVAEDVMGAARRWAQDILVCSPMSVRATKEAVLRGLDTPLEVSAETVWTYAAMVEMLASQDAAEGPKAFTEKRAADWRGR